MTSLSRIYFLLFILGTVIPLAALAPWVMENGLNIPLMLTTIASAPLSLFAWLDVFVAAICLILFIWVDGKKNAVQYRWAAIIATLCIGVSAGLPLYLYLREIAKQKR